MPQMLGKKVAKYDRRTLRLARYLAPQLPTRPDKSDWTPKVSNWPVYLNDQLGDCACAMVGHARQCWTANDGTIITPSDDDVLQAYEKVGGYQPGNPATDGGCVMLDLLNAWRREGLCGGKIGAYAAIHHGDIETALSGCHYFGGLMMGVQLPQAIQGNDGPWLAPPTAQQHGAWEPGSWGGHAILGCGYDTATQRLKFISWGKVMEMSFNFLQSYGDELYVCVSADWLGSDFTSPAGLDIALLLQDLSAIQATV